MARRIVRGNRYLAHLFAIPLDRGRIARAAPADERHRARRLAAAVARTAARVAFVRSDPTKDDEPATLVVLDLARGGSRRVRRHGLRVGRRGRLVARRPAARVHGRGRPAALPRRTGPTGRRRGAANGIRGAAAEEPSPLARRIERTDWRWDGIGHQDRWAHLFVVDAARGAVPRQVTAGDWGVADIAWSPDGRTVAFASDPRPGADLRPRTTIWAVDVDDVAGDGPGRGPRGSPSRARS